MTISIELAREILEVCKQRARELNSPVSIAIVDAGGHLVLFERMMAPYGWATGNISIAKAHTAVMFNQSTDSVAQWAGAIPGFSASLASMTDGKFILAAGGWPIRVNGITIGGIGVSGGNAPGRDDEIARLGLNVVNAPQYGQYSQPYQPMQSAPPQYAPQAQPGQVAQSVPFYQPVQPQPVPAYSAGSSADNARARPEIASTPSAPSVPPLETNSRENEEHFQPEQENSYEASSHENSTELTLSDGKSQNRPGDQV